MSAKVALQFLDALLNCRLGKIFRPVERSQQHWKQVMDIGTGFGTIQVEMVAQDIKRRISFEVVQQEEQLLFWRVEPTFWPAPGLRLRLALFFS